MLAYTANGDLMITYEEAKAKVEKLINKPGPHLADKPTLVVLDNQTIEKEWGWVFFYQSLEFIESGDFEDMLAGNAPYIVNRKTGELVVTGTSLPIEDYISNYEISLDS